MNPMEQAAAIAQRIVQIANSENFGDFRSEMIHETTVDDLMTDSTDPFRFVRAVAVVQLLGIALVEILDEAKSAPPPAVRVLRRPAAVDDELRERDG
ncbi:hypothetical protein J2Y69_002769 [Microbacterium resistens]|uniref:Uncharacterized protein n=1 Tax=Microbacterium resistens TaxID=156977 RepID=A0ABU1SFS7_9MICO|nr:hypothetical protein [Microbacterium resistens]MDR6868158.1 hypothetical protein [Microbacterium resistens]